MRAGVTEAGSGYSGPGMDPRDWVKLAVVDEVEITPDGVFLDCTTQPDGFPIRAKVAPLFAGAGFGLYYPVQAGDQVVAVFPDGNGNGQPVVLSVLHNGTDTVPQEAQDDPDSLWIVTAAGKKIRLKTSLLDVDGDAHVSGDVVVTGKVTASGFAAGSSPGVTTPGAVPVHTLTVVGGIVTGYT